MVEYYNRRSKEVKQNTTKKEEKKVKPFKSIEKGVMLWTVFHEHHKVAVLADKEKQRPAKEIDLCCHSAEQKTSIAYVMIGMD